jgi:primosomal protein N' (replication factor Y)
LVAVVLPVPVNRSYIYEVPDALAERVVPGARVVVPLRARRMVGIVTEAVSRQPSAVSNIKPIIAAPDEHAALSPALLSLGRWISDYYGAPL